MTFSDAQSKSHVRQIYFYQLSDVRDLWNESTPPFNVKLFANEMRALQGIARYGHGSNEYDLCIIPDSEDSFRFGKVYTQDSTKIETDGQIQPLILPNGHYLINLIHIVFFPSGVVGAEFSQLGPRMPALTEYMVNKLHSCKPVVFSRLVHGDIMERLKRVQEVKLVQLQVDTAQSDIIAPFVDGWEETKQSLKSQFDVGTIEITLRAGITSRRSLGARTISAVRGMFRSSDSGTAANKFKITAVLDGTGEPVDIDLLDDKLVASVEIPKSIYRNPERYKEYMYGKIRAAYQSLRADILHAARIIQ